MRQLFSGKFQKLYMAVFAVSLFAPAAPAFSNVVAPPQVIHLEGTSNTRDIGGYLTDDLRTIRYGQIIRSENLSRLTAADFQKLEAMGVKTVIDLRTNKEHHKAPTVWQGEHPPQFFHFPVGDADNEWFQAQRRMLKNDRFRKAHAEEHMQEGYRMIAREGPPSYQQLMDVVLDESNWPIVIHCNAGKDRAGIAVALIMEALGVDRETIMDEYLLTNELSRTKEKAALLAKESRKFRRIGRGPSASAWFPIVGVQPEMLEAFYASVEEQYGSVDAFLADLGVDKAARNELVASLTTDANELAMGE